MHSDDTQQQVPSPAEQDANIERLVLTQVLVHHPVQLSIIELMRQVDMDPDEFAEMDSVERAVRELTNDGLLHAINSRLVAPTKAALRFDALLGGHI